MLEKTFDEEEIHSMIHSCALDKAPGSDGFTMVFFLRTWDFSIQKWWELLDISIRIVLKSCNASSIARIPKRKGTVELND